uniref:Uncharacterized protein n=1 Tax=Arundo donax TaxID=35708 RepID=A0A0A8YBQ3_ARUDO
MSNGRTAPAGASRLGPGSDTGEHGAAPTGHSYYGGAPKMEDFVEAVELDHEQWRRVWVEWGEKARVSATAGLNRAAEGGA